MKRNNREIDKLYLRIDVFIWITCSCLHKKCCERFCLINWCHLWLCVKQAPDQIYLGVRFQTQIWLTTNKLNPHLFSLCGQFFWVSINTLVTVLKARYWLWELLTVACRPSFWREAAPSTLVRITWPSIWWIKLSTESLTILATWILGSPD